MEQFKAIIVDECHALSKAAIQSLLKSIEEPPDWAAWFLCTTEGVKILDTIKTRCTVYNLKPVPVPTLFDFLCKIADKEQLSIDKQIIDLCVKEAGGSPRQALSNLAVCTDAGSRAEAAILLRSATETPEAFRLAQALARGLNWDQVRPILAGIQEQNPESVRHVIRAYFTKVALNENGPKAEQAIAILDSFREPFHPADGITPLILAVARLII